MEAELKSLKIENLVIGSVCFLRSYRTHIVVVENIYTYKFFNDDYPSLVADVVDVLNEDIETRHICNEDLENGAYNLRYLV
jgi:hypothetical protein